MALMMIMGLALLIYALAERQLRLGLEKNNEKIPDQKGKPTSTPTIRWVFQTFEGIDILSVWVNGQSNAPPGAQPSPSSPADHPLIRPSSP